MMSRAPRWPETLSDTKNNKPPQNKGAKERGPSTPNVCTGATQTGSSSVSKSSLASVRSNSLGRSRDSAVAASGAGGSLKRNVFGNQAARQSRPAVRLGSSRSFSSLNTSSLTAAPFTRSSRSLNRLDQRFAGEDAEAASQRGRMRESKAAGFGQLTSSEPKSRAKRDECQRKNTDKKKADSASSSAEGIKKQTRDGVYTLCAMTSGMRRNWVHAVLKNVRPGNTHGNTSPVSEQAAHLEGSPATVDFDTLSQDHETRDYCVQELKSANGGSPQRLLLEESEGVTRHRFARAAATAQDNASLSNGSSGECFGEALASRTPVEGKVQVSVDASRGDSGGTGGVCLELEQTSKEVSRLEQINKNLQVGLRQETSSDAQDSSKPSTDLALALQRLQKENQDLRLELESQKRSQEQAREAELRRRVDLLAQQAQLLVTGDATALAQAHLEQDHRRFAELQAEWEGQAASMRSQLSSSQQQRSEAELRLTQLQQELQGCCAVRQEADDLRGQLREATSQLRTYEEAQAEKEARLQKHLMLLQASQDRERRSLIASLAQADERSRALQARLDSAEEQVGKLSQCQTWAREVEVAQEQVQEELARTVSAVERLQEERGQLEQRCSELQGQLSEADGAVTRLQSRLKTDETHYYNLEHSYEKACEELQLALGKVREKESETQEMREGYECLLDTKEQELSEVLLKMEVLGNSLEETEVKLSDLLKACTCSSPPSRDTSLQPAEEEFKPKGEKCILSKTPSGQQDVLSAGDDPERFLSVIQLLETKLYATEEKLRDIMQRLEEQQSHAAACHDPPPPCSQLTRSRAAAQHLSLLLHSTAKRSQRFARDAERRSARLLARLRAALGAAQNWREALQANPDAVPPDMERQLAAIAASLQQGEQEAEEQQRESLDAIKEDEKILNDQDLPAADGDESRLTENFSNDGNDLSVNECLARELFVVEQLVSFLQSQSALAELFLVSREAGSDIARRYHSVVGRRIAMAAQSCGNAAFSKAIGRVCSEAELICGALRLQQQYGSMSGEKTLRTEGTNSSLADVDPPELAAYDHGGGRGGKESGDITKGEDGKCPAWLERLWSKLQRRSQVLQQLIQEICDANDGEERSRLDGGWEIRSAADLNAVLEEAKVIYLCERLSLDPEQERHQNQIGWKGEGHAFRDENEALRRTWHRLQEDDGSLRDEAGCAGKTIMSVESRKQRLLRDIENIQDIHERQTKKLETEFQEKLRKLQQIHEEEMKRLHHHYTKSRDKQAPKGQTAGGVNEGDAAGTSENDMGKPKSPCHGGVSAMEERHQRQIADLQQQHQKEVAAVLTEEDQQLKEETAATVTAIVAMRRAHKVELEKSQQMQHSRESADLTRLQVQYEKETEQLQKELDALSEQHTQKCLENSQLYQELQDEREALTQCQKENRGLQEKQTELQFLPNGMQPRDTSGMSDFYEMEMMVRAREAEMQFLRQEASSLRKELEVARMDKLYAQNKLKSLCAESPDRSQFATWSPMRSDQKQDGSKGTNASHSFLRRKTSSLTRQIRVVRSKSLKEGLSVQERMKLFESL